MNEHAAAAAKAARTITINEHQIENAIAEIEHLRRRIEIQDAQLRIVNGFFSLTEPRTNTNMSTGYGPDAVWALRRALNPPMPTEDVRSTDGETT